MTRMLTEKPDVPRELTLSADINIEAAEAVTGGEGMPARPRKFHMDAYTGGPLTLAGWRFPVVVDLDGLSIRGGAKVYLDHNRTARVGHLEAVNVLGGRLRVTGVVSSTSAAAREVVADAENGYPWQASIGASVQEVEFVPEGRTLNVNGREVSGPINVARRSQLSEVSFVGNGADDQTSASIAAGTGAAREKEHMDVVTNETTEVVTEQNSVEGHEQTATGEGKGQVAAPVQTLEQQTAGTVEAADPVKEIRARALLETNRISAIRRICNGRFAEIEAKAIEEGWDETKTELEVLRASRPKAPAAHVPDNPMSGRLLEAACMISARFEGVEKEFDEKTLDAADKRFRGGLGLQELLLEAAWANGYTGRTFRDSRAVLRHAFADIQAGFSTVDIGGILSNVANKFLLDGFFSVERVWRNICALRSVRDFKTVTSYRLVGKDQYEIVAPGGELKHGTLGEESYANRADTYGLMLSVDRRDIINDDLGAITTVPRKLGRGSGLKINDVFWSVFLANSSFFSAGNANYVSGADTVLGIDGLTKGEVTFMDQVDADNKPIGIMPSILLVPTALSAMAMVLHKSLEIRDTTSSTKYPVANPHAGKFRTEVSRYLSNSRYTGASSKAWYLLADPGDLPVIEVAFLNGQESPTIETAEADFNVLGVQMRGYHDFGVALQDPRGGVKAKGEA